MAPRPPTCPKRRSARSSRPQRDPNRLVFSAHVTKRHAQASLRNARTFDSGVVATYDSRRAYSESVHCWRRGRGLGRRSRLALHVPGPRVDSLYRQEWGRVQRSTSGERSALVGGLCGATPARARRRRGCSPTPEWRANNETANAQPVVVEDRRSAQGARTPLSLARRSPPQGTFVNARASHCVPIRWIYGAEDARQTVGARTV